MTKIILGISGSIAAYKSIELAKLFLEAGLDFRLVLSKSASDFISPLTLKSLFPGKVFLSSDLLGEGDEMLHISLAKSASLIVIAPASANMIAKLANGYADCLLSTLCLATNAPIIVAPAMNKVMWENEFVQANVAKLSYVIGPSSGKQACGDEGFGRMLEPVEIFEHIKSFNVEKKLQGRKILITAGPTIEAIDPVRFISNNGSGKMGYAIAKMAKLMGAEVTLISGPTGLAAPKDIKTIHVKSADEMLNACLIEAKHNDVFISAAAVADYKPEIFHTQKIKKNNESLEIKLTKNPDIITQVKKEFPQIFSLGFAAETNNIKEYGRKKLIGKNLDMIAINDVSSGKVFGSNQNELHVIDKNGKEYFIERDSKEVVAKQLLEIMALV
jgi:phosphopantothenoylcysteine decarboxylase/phosphopantothenate--cysteine ligase